LLFRVVEPKAWWLDNVSTPRLGVHLWGTRKKEEEEEKEEKLENYKGPSPLLKFEEGEKLQRAKPSVEI